MEKLRKFTTKYGYEGFNVLVEHCFDNPDDEKAKDLVHELLAELSEALKEFVMKKGEG